MARCNFCGNIVPDGQEICPVCGAQAVAGNNAGYANGGAANQQNMNQQYNYQEYNNGGYGSQNQGYGSQNQGYTNQNQYGGTYQNQQNTVDGTDYTYMYDPMDIANNKVMAVLSYLGILFLIPLLANKDSRYARFHTSQGINLFVICVVIQIIRGASGFIGGLWIVSAATGLLSFGTFVLTIMGIVYAATGRAKELPVIGKMRILSMY